MTDGSVDGAPGAEIDVPAGWERVGPAGGVALLARPVNHAGRVRPTIVVTDTVDPALAGADTGRYVEVQLGQAYATFGGHLVHVEVSHRPELHLDLMLAVEQMGVDATVVQRHLIRPGGRAIVATGLAADVDWPDMAAVLVPAVRSLRTRSTS